MRGQPALLNGEITRPHRSEAEARAERAAKRPYLGFAFQPLFDEAMDRAETCVALGEQHDEHVRAYEGRLHMKFLDYLDTKMDEREHCL